MRRKKKKTLKTYPSTRAKSDTHKKAKLSRPTTSSQAWTPNSPLAPRTRRKPNPTPRPSPTSTYSHTLTGHPHQTAPHNTPPLPTLSRHPPLHTYSLHSNLPNLQHPQPGPLTHIRPPQTALQQLTVGAEVIPPPYPSPPRSPHLNLGHNHKHQPTPPPRPTDPSPTVTRIHPPPTISSPANHPPLTSPLHITSIQPHQTHPTTTPVQPKQKPP
jgi:hypothetical protein